MTISARTLFAAGVLLSPVAALPLDGQVLHVNDQWDNCAIELDPSLTQAAWHQFVRELGIVAYFRPMASARPLGTGHFEVGLLDWGTRIDDADPAWNDTFTHPDSAHWLFDGDALLIPGLMLRAGVTDRLDAGAYYTRAIGANYSIFGGQLQYAFLNDRDRGLAAAGRASGVWLTGPDDMGASVYGLDLVVSRDVSFLSPYAGVSGYVARGHERTSKVDLDDETVAGVQGMVGVEMRVSVLRLGAEVDLARVSGYSFKVSFGR